MTDKLNEKISALMDDQLGAHEVDALVERMQHDQPLRHCWARYHLIGDALRNNRRHNLPDNVNHDLAARISKTIETEVSLPISLETYRHTKARTTMTGVAATFFKPLIGMAIAASVALVAIVSFNTTNGVDSVGQQLVMAPLQNKASMMASQPVVAPVTEQAAERATEQVAVNSKLADYLEDHSKYSTFTTVQGQMLPYVRMVGYAPKE